MQGIHTHYENLKVSRDAHPKIIRKAYKKLSSQYHPDHNNNNPEATKVMQVINLAYDVLSDPVRRKEHDEWIARMEAEQRQSQTSQNEPAFESVWREAYQSPRNAPPFFRYAGKERPESIYRPKKASSQNLDKLDKSVIEKHIYKNWFWYMLAIAVAMVFAYHSYSRNTYSPFITVPQQHQLHSKPANGKSHNLGGKNGSTAPAAQAGFAGIPDDRFMREETAPDGLPWPAAASYLSGFEQANSTGLSNVTVDNARRESDVLVKLYYLEGDKPRAVRVFFIPARSSFKAEKLTPGLYDLRFLDLQSGLLYRTEPFELQEMALTSGARFTGISMSLNQNGAGGEPLAQKLAHEDF